jgi:hypothetical protein
MRIGLLISLKDEAPYIVDWIAYHRALGVTDFYVFQNDSVDGSDALCAALDAAGVIRYFDNSDPRAAPRARKQPAQRRAYAWAMHLPEVQALDFIMPLDVDEYLDIPDASLPDTITRLGADAISLPWRMFGADKAVDFKMAPVIERFTRAATPTSQGAVRPHTQVKTLVRPRVVKSLNLHIPNFSCEASWVLSDGRDARFVMGRENWVSNPDFGAAYVRHYHVKSMAEFCAKIVRGFASHQGASPPQICLPMYHEMNVNEVEAPCPAHRIDAAQAMAAEVRVGDVALAEAIALEKFTRLLDLSARAVAAQPSLHTGSYKDATPFAAYFKSNVYDLM